MGYLVSIKTAFLVFPFLAFFITIPFILIMYHKYGSIHKFRTFIIYTFILYLLVIYFLVILPLPKFSSVINNKGPFINFIPFKFLIDFIKETSFVWNKPSTYLIALKEPCFYTAFFNILITIPFGMYLRYYFKCSLKKTILLSFFLSLFFELTQLSGLYFIYPKPYRLCDVDDLILNTLGGTIGYFLFGAIEKYLPSRDLIDEEAYQLGMNVSGFKRITAFFLDFVIFLAIYFFCYLFFSSISYLFYIVFFFYYGIIPFINGMSTLGMKFLNLKMVYKRYGFIFNLLRICFLYFYYFIMPWGLFVYFLMYFSNSSLSNRVFYALLVCLFLFLFYIIHFLLFLFKKKHFADYLFGFSYISTVHLKEEEK